MALASVEWKGDEPRAAMIARYTTIDPAMPNWTRPLCSDAIS